MDPVIALVGLGGVVVAALALGFVLRAREGRARPVAAHAGEDPALVGADAWGERATLLQFSTEFCTRCPGVHRTLDAIAQSTPGVVHLDVDLTHRTDLARHFRVLQTPTTLILDSDGVIRTRLGGTVARATIEHELEHFTGERHVRV